MERRLITFFMASTAFLMVYLSLQVMMAPPPKPGAQANQTNDKDNQDALLVDGKDKDSDSAGNVANDSTSGDSANPTDASVDDDPTVPRSTEPSWYTLGSMDPAAGYNMLVTLNNRGAGIERIELTKRDTDGNLKYHRVDTRTGYFGYVAPAAAGSIDGVRVNVVGPGTPVDAAGLEVGDIITSIASNPIRGPSDIDGALKDTKPGQSVSCQVVRGGDSTPVTLDVVLSEHPLDLIRLAEFGGVDQVKGNLSRLSCLMTLAQVNRKTFLAGGQKPTIDPAGLIWDAELAKPEAGQPQRIDFSLDLTAAEMEQIGGTPLRMGHSYSLEPGTYALQMEVQLENTSEQAQDLALRLEGANGLTLEGWWYSNKISPNWSGAAARDVIYKTSASGHQLLSGYNLLKKARKDTKDPYETIFAPDSETGAKSLSYIGLDAQYFTVTYTPPKGSSSFTAFHRAGAGVVADVDKVPRHQERAVNSSFYLDSVTASVPPGGAMRQELTLFAGPKEPEVVEPFGLGDSVYYGWFGAFARPLEWLLHFLAGMIGHYGIAIILLTVVVRGAMFPLSRKAAVNAQKMQELAPELKKITEKYKDDLEGRMRAQRELQQRVGFNPMAGCLPMFMQLPIFIGLYRALSVDIELRQKPFLPGIDWASNLAAPDQFSYWGNWMFDYFAGRGVGWLGPYFNILPVVVVGLFLLQQKLFMPPATDEQTAMTQKMMSYMTLFMGLFFFRVPAGLCIYFITSSLWGICERVLVKKTLPAKTHFDPGVLEGSAVPTEKKKVASLAERIKEQVNKPEPKFDPPNKRKRPKL